MWTKSEEIDFDADREQWDQLLDADLEYQQWLKEQQEQDQEVQDADHP